MADIPSGAAPAAAPAAPPTPSASPATSAGVPQSSASSTPVDSSAGSAPSGEPPRERWDAILRNAREKTRAEVQAEYQERYGKYDAFERDPLSAVQAWVEEARQHSLYGPMVQQWLQSQVAGQGPQGEEPQADVPIVDGQGQVTGYTFSDRQLRAWHQWNQDVQQQQLEQRLAPLEQYRQQAEQQQEYQGMVQAANERAADTLQDLRQQPYFRAHEPAIRQALLDHEEWGDNVHAAYNHVLVTQILPNLSTAEQQQVLSSLQASGQANTVAPGGTAPGQTRFKSFGQAMEYLSKHPDEAQALANRR